MDWINNVDWASVINAAGVIALAVAAATPTQKDDTIVGRVVNLASLIVPTIFRKK